MGERPSELSMVSPVPSFSVKWMRTTMPLSICMQTPAQGTISALAVLANRMLLLPLMLSSDVPPEARAVWTRMAQVQRLQADFTQVRTSRLLSRPFSSTGELRFERPGRLAWEVREPSASLFVMDGTTVGMWYPDLGVREEIDLSGSPEAASLVQGMMIWLGGDLDQVSEQYDMAWDPPMATLTPKDDAMRAVVDHLDLTLAGEPPLVTSVVIHEPDGDRVEITLTKVRVDPVLPADAFLLPQK